jgi:tetratricopeptide (TPR) repeat protein
MTAATFAVLGKIFSDPALPASWRAMRDRAYSQAHLRATASYYHAGDFSKGQAHISEAVKLNPELLTNEAQPLANHLASLAASPKNRDPLSFLEGIYRHLPDSLQVLRRRGSQDLGQMSVRLAFEAYQKGDLDKTQKLVLRAIRYHPAWLVNRGVVSMFLSSLFHY